MGSDNGAPSKRLLLVWDAPNLCIRGGTAVLTHPKSEELLGVDRIGVWLRRRAAARGMTASATVFMNVSPHKLDANFTFARAVMEAGFALHARPKQQRTDDVDQAMVEHLKGAMAAGDVGEVIVASHDRRAFAAVLGQAAHQGVAASVLGHCGRANWVDGVNGVSFIDLRFVAACTQSLEVNTPPEGVGLVIAAMRELLKDSETGWVRKSRLRPMMTSLQPSFSPAAAGDGSLNQLLSACGDRVRTRQAVGDHELTLAGA